MFFIAEQILPIVKTLESRNNPVIKKAVKAAKGLCDEPLILTEGYKLTREALLSHATPAMVFVETSSAIKDLQQLAPHTFIVPRTVLNEISTVQTPADIIAFFYPQPQGELAAFLSTARMLVVLDRIQDPGNLGTIIRTSEAMGADAVILLQNCCSQHNAKAVRAAMGSSFRLPVFADVCFRKLIVELSNYSFATLAADMNGTPLPGFAFSQRCALFLGQEGRGLATEILKECTSRLAIPMQGQVESLNVATSAAICLYEWSRNQKN